MLANCSLRDGTINFRKYASTIFLLRVFLGALVSTYQLNSCSMFLAKCFAGSVLSFTLLYPSYFTISHKNKSFWYTGFPKFPLFTKEIQLQVNCTELSEKLWTYIKQKELEVNTLMQVTQNMLWKKHCQES